MDVTRKSARKWIDSLSLRVQQALFAAAAYLILLAICLLAISPEQYDLSVGDVAPKTITASKDIVDELTTERRRQAAADAVSPVYYKDDTVSYTVLSDMDAVFSELRAVRELGEQIRNAWGDEGGSFTEADYAQASGLVTRLSLSNYQLRTLMNTGEKPVFSKNGLVTTIAWGLDGKVEYALEGSIFVAGAAIQWLRDQLKVIDSSPDSEYMARKVKDTNGCYVVPAFTGLGAPHWDQYARGTIVGLTRGCNKYHIIRATLDSLCYQVNDVLQAMKADSGIDLAALKVDGGASANNYLMQTQADLIDAPVQRPRCVETTAMGAAYLAGLAVGYWSSKEDVIKNWAIDRTFEPEIAAEDRAARIKGWNKAVKCSYGWAKDE